MRDTKHLDDEGIREIVRKGNRGETLTPREHVELFRFCFADVEHEGGVFFLQRAPRFDD